MDYLIFNKDFGKEYGLTVESKLSQGTKATVCIPVDFKREEDRK